MQQRPRWLVEGYLRPSKFEDAWKGENTEVSKTGEFSGIRGTAEINTKTKTTGIKNPPPHQKKNADLSDREEKTVHSDATIGKIAEHRKHLPSKYNEYRCFDMFTYADISLVLFPRTTLRPNSLPAHCS